MIFIQATNLDQARLAAKAMRAKQHRWCFVGDVVDLLRGQPTSKDTLVCVEPIAGSILAVYRAAERCKDEASLRGMTIKGMST